MKKPLPLYASLAVSLALISGCATLNQVPAAKQPIPCAYRFKDITRLEEQARINQLILEQAVPGSVEKKGTPAYPEYHFKVARFAVLDTLHPRLLSLGLKGSQTLNLLAPSVAMTFGSTDVKATMTVTVTFSVRPGSKLFYRDVDGKEIDISGRVGPKGKVSLPTKIRKGQEFIYARAAKDAVTRYIRINIFTNEVKDIEKREY